MTWKVRNSDDAMTNWNPEILQFPPHNNAQHWKFTTTVFSSLQSNNQTWSCQSLVNNNVSRGSRGYVIRVSSSFSYNMYAVKCRTIEQQERTVITSPALHPIEFIISAARWAWMHPDRPASPRRRCFRLVSPPCCTCTWNPAPQACPSHIAPLQVPHQSWHQFS